MKMFTKILGDEEGVICHVDDILIWGSSVEEHDDRVRGVLKKD